jgi:hypothetical protein
MLEDNFSSFNGRNLDKAAKKTGNFSNRGEKMYVEEMFRG